MIRWEKIWVLATKEFKEFRRNRFIIYSLILMPLLLTTILPALYIIPISMLTPDPQKDPLDLHLNISNYDWNVSKEGIVVENHSYEGSELNQVVAIGCIFRNCTITDSTIIGCQLNETLLVSSVANGCNLENVTYISSTLEGSVIIGEETQAEATLGIMISAMLLFFLLIPTIVPTVVASYTFVGEKLNRSLEPLLMTPTSDVELLLGKSISILIPSVLITWVAFVPFTLIVDYFTYPVLDYYPLPNVVYVMGVFLLAPLICLLSIFANVIVSSRVNDVRSAQQIGSLVVLPVVGFFIVVIAGVATLNEWFMLGFAGIILLADGVVLWVALRLFKREEILLRWK